MCSKMYVCTKINTSKFLFNLDTVDEEPLCGNATANSHSRFIFYLKSYQSHALNQCKINYDPH